MALKSLEARLLLAFMASFERVKCASFEALCEKVLANICT